MKTLPLYAPLPSPARPLSNDWRLHYSQHGAGAEQGYADPDYDDSAWERALPRHLLRQGTSAHDTVWYRCHLEGPPPEAGRRWLLRIGGAFYHTRLWLNGVALGEHTGYFQPFGADLTQALRSGANVLAVCCYAPVEAGSFKRKTALIGIFADWDCKPYPSAFYPNLPAPSEWRVPAGLWQPAGLHAHGALLVETLAVFPEFAPEDFKPGAPGPGRAVVNVRLAVRNLTPEPRATELRIAIEPGNFSGPVAAQVVEALALAGHERRELNLTLTLEQPRLWWPWTHGEPWLYHARVLIDGATLLRPFGVRHVTAEIDRRNGWAWRLNGRRIFPKGSNYIAGFDLDRVTPDGLARDIELARGANLDLLRVHAHIAPPDFYRLCDEQGLLVMCDFPQIWTYAYGLEPAAGAAFQASVRRQAESMVALLGSHPSIVLWSLHNEPPWTPDGSFLGQDVHGSATNKASDEAAAGHVRALDPTRPAIAASGEHDQHLYHGWYTGHWRDNRELRPSFPTEFGVQALPNLDSPFWATVNTAWPVESDDPSWAHAGYQSIFWASPGVGAPAQYATLAEYVGESQAYQAFYIRYVIDQWRRRKFDPTGGYIHFLFSDGWPAITWAVLDYYRLAKAGYAALAAASRPVRLCLDLGAGYTVERAFHIVFNERDRLRVQGYLVNDDYRASGAVQVEWWLERRDGRQPWRALANGWRRLRAGRARVTLPGADEGARQVLDLDVALRAAGEYALRTRVRQGGRVLDENALEFRVGAPRREHKHARRVPGLLVRKVYQAGSLHHTADGFTFSLRNPAMPVLTERLGTLLVDDQPVDPAQVEIVCGGQARRATTITPQSPFELPSGERLAVIVRDLPLVPGVHEIEITAYFAGFGEVTARIKDKLV